MKNEIDILKDVIQKLESLNIDYMLTGSIAMIYYAKPRMTRDIDLVIELNKIKIPGLITVFSKEYYISEEAVEDSVESQFLFNIIHLESAIKIDCIIRKENKYSETEFLRRKEVDFFGIKLFIVSREDLIISKLFWAKDSNSEQQIRDIRNLISDNINNHYINNWTSKLGIDEFWKEIRNE
jgi:hypothetical protein